MDVAAYIPVDVRDPGNQRSHRPHDGTSIAGNIRLHYPAWMLQGIVALLFLANTINLGADLGAMGNALTLLLGGPQLLNVVIFGWLAQSSKFS